MLEYRDDQVLVSSKHFLSYATRLSRMLFNILHYGTAIPVALVYFLMDSSDFQNDYCRYLRLHIITKIIIAFGRFLLTFSINLHFTSYLD